MTTIQINIPSGDASVWCVDGFHFLVRSDNESERYYSQHGTSFLRAYETGVRDLLLGPEETDRDRLKLLRGLWEKFINAEFARQNPI
jgi:hypothetical protein